VLWIVRTMSSATARWAGDGRGWSALTARPHLDARQLADLV
jgi:hypothetical protein